MSPKNCSESAEIPRELIKKITTKTPRHKEEKREDYRASSLILISAPQNDRKYPLCVLCAFVVHFIFIGKK